MASYRIGADQVRGSLQCGILVWHVSALGHKRTCALQKVMSALPPKADMCSATRDVRFGPKADIDCYNLFDGNDLKAPGEDQVKNAM